MMKDKKKYRFFPTSIPGRVARGVLVSSRAGLPEQVICHGFRPDKVSTPPPWNLKSRVWFTCRHRQGKVHTLDFSMQKLQGKWNLVWELLALGTSTGRSRWHFNIWRNPWISSKFGNKVLPPGFPAGVWYSNLFCIFCKFVVKWVHLGGGKYS